MGSDLRDLLARVEAATGPDRALSTELCKTFGWHRVSPSASHTKNGDYIAPDEWMGAYEDGSPILSQSGTTIHRETPHVTASLDAALALVERLGFHAIVNTFHPFANVARDGFFSMGSMVEAKTAPLSVCAALLKALTAEIPADRGAGEPSEASTSSQTRDANPNLPHQEGGRG